MFTLRRGRAQRTHTHTHTHATRLLWTRHRPIAETTQHNIRKRHSCFREDSNLQSQRASSRRPHTFHRAATGISETNTYVNKIRIILRLTMAVQTATVVLCRASSCALLPLPVAVVFIPLVWNIYLQDRATRYNCTTVRCSQTALRTGVTIRNNMWDFVFTPLWRFTTESHQVQITSSVMLAAL